MKILCIDTWKEYKRKREQWHNWFAWRPVGIKNAVDAKICIYWLQYIRRKGNYTCNFAESSWNWEYSLLSLRSLM